MKSSLGWIDFSSEHRDKVTRVIDLLSAPGTVDELGIGIIRNAFSNRLFPGLSTIQTRAKYFMIVPRILRSYDALPEREKSKFPNLAKYLQQEEDHCNRLLVEKHHGENELGIFGAENVAQNKLLQRMPSSVYWNGLRTFGLVETRLSLGEFLVDYQRRLRDDGYHHGSTLSERGDDHDAGEIPMQTVKIPDANTNWKDTLSIKLTTIEAEYLQGAVVQNAKGSLLGYLLGAQSRMEELLTLHADDFKSLLTLHCVKELQNNDKNLYQVVQAAVDFWQVMEGAHIRYNQLLQKHNSNSNGHFDAMWEKWNEEISSDTHLWSHWNSAKLWELVHENGSVLKDTTRSFVERWSQAIRTNNIKSLDEIVKTQEKLNKG